MPPKRESDRLLERLRTLVHDRGRGDARTKPESRSRETEHHRAEPGDVKRTAATTTISPEVRE